MASATTVVWLVRRDQVERVDRQLRVRQHLTDRGRVRRGRVQRDHLDGVRKVLLRWLSQSIIPDQRRPLTCPNSPCARGRRTRSPTGRPVATFGAAGAAGEQSTPVEGIDETRFGAARWTPPRSSRGRPCPIGGAVHPVHRHAFEAKQQRRALLHSLQLPASLISDTARIKWSRASRHQDAPKPASQINFEEPRR
jgi:hypothetical protein